MFDTVCVTVRYIYMTAERSGNVGGSTCVCTEDCGRDCGRDCGGENGGDATRFLDRADRRHSSTNATPATTAAHPATATITTMLEPEELGTSLTSTTGEPSFIPSDVVKSTPVTTSLMAE